MVRRPTHDSATYTVHTTAQNTFPRGLPRLQEAQRVRDIARFSRKLLIGFDDVRWTMDGSIIVYRLSSIVKFTNHIGQLYPLSSILYPLSSAGYRNNDLAILVPARRPEGVGAAQGGQVEQRRPERRAELSVAT